MRERSVLVLLVFVAGLLSAAAPATANTVPDAVMVWQHRDTGSTATWDIWYSTFADGAWSASGGPVAQAAPLAVLSGDDKNPHVSTNPSGKTIAVWQRAAGTGASPGKWDIWWSQFQSGAWTTPTGLDTVSTDSYDPNVAVDPNGSAVTVWVQRTASGPLRIRWSQFDGTSWSAPVNFPSGGDNASLPEITVTSVLSAGGVVSRRYVAVWSDTPAAAGGARRMMYSIFDGVSWTTPAQIESAATGLDVSIGSVVFANYVGTTPDPFGAFGRVGATWDLQGQAYVMWGSGPTILGIGSPGVVGAILDVANNTWLPMQTSGGGRFIGVGGCENPDVTATSGGGDIIGNFSFAGSMEHTVRTQGVFLGESFSYSSPGDDQRPSNAALSATEVISVNWTAPVGSTSEIYWSVGDVIPGTNVNFGQVQRLVPGGLPGQDMFPEIASAPADLLVPRSANAFTATVTAHGGPVPIAIEGLGDVRTAGHGAEGSESNAIQEVELPAGLGTVSVGRNIASHSLDRSTAPPSGSSRARSSIDHVTLLDGLIEIEGLTAAAGADVAPDDAEVSSAGSGIRRLVVDGEEVAVTGEPVDIPIPDVGTLSLFSETSNVIDQTIAEILVRGVHLQATVGDLDVEVILASAYAGTSFAASLTPLPPTGMPTVPGVPGVGDWPGGAVPNVPCHELCFGELPGDDESHDIAGVATLSRSRGYYSSENYSYSYGYTTLSIPAAYAYITLEEQVANNTYSYPGYESGYDQKRLRGTVTVGDESVVLDGSRTVNHWSYESGDWEEASNDDRSILDLQASGTAGSLRVKGDVRDAAYMFSYPSWGDFDSRDRRATIEVWYDAPTGESFFLQLQPSYSGQTSGEDAEAVIRVSGYVSTPLGPEAIGPFEVPLPARPH